MKWYLGDCEHPAVDWGTKDKRHKGKEATQEHRSLSSCKMNSERKASNGLELGEERKESQIEKVLERLCPPAGRNPETGGHEECLRSSQMAGPGGGWKNRS